MSTYLKNLSLLKKSLGYPVLELPQSEPPAHSAIEIIEARKSSITLIYKGKYLHSRFDPIKESKQILSRLLPGGLSYDIIILAGMGAGHFLTALANYEIDKIIVFEPDIDLFKQILKQELISSILKSHGNKLFITSKLEEMIKFFNSIYHYGLKSKLIIPPIYEQMFPAQTKLLVKHLSETRLNIDGIETTELADSFTWMKNFWQNLPIILNNHSSGELAKFVKNLPVFIVSAGPSLDKNIHLLKKIEGKGIIISTDAVFAKLAKAGIKPDFTVAIECDQFNATFFQGNEDTLKETILLLNAYSHPQLYKFKARKIYTFYLATEKIIDQLFISAGFESGSLYFSGTVSSAAFSMAYLMGGNPIVLLGQDLAYSGGRTYASGTYRGDIQFDFNQDDFDLLYFDQNGNLSEKESAFTVPGLFCEKLFTSRALKSYHGWFENAFFTIKKQLQDLLVINATEDGALIKNALHMKLAEVVDKYIYRINPLHNVERIKKPEKSFLPKGHSAAVLKSRQVFASRLSEIIKSSSELLDYFEAPQPSKQSFNVKPKAVALLKFIDSCQFSQQTFKFEVHRFLHIDKKASLKDRVIPLASGIKEKGEKMLKLLDQNF